MSAEVIRIPGDPCRVLVADDEHLVAMGLVTMLEEIGHEVVGVAADGEAAVELARRHRPELALLDIRMPKVNGIDVANALQRELGIPSIIVSAYSDDEHLSRMQEHGSESGIYGYLLKPISGDELRVAIRVARQRVAVDGHRAERVKQLEQNLANRRIVEQAKWRLVETMKMTEPAAHDHLQKLARNTRRPLVDVARGVLEGEGTPPESPAAPA
jgi:response regulator NasT